MKTAIVGLIGILSAACSGSAREPNATDNASGDGGALNASDGCSKADQLGDFVVHFEETAGGSGNCGTPADEHAIVTSLDQLGPCERTEPDTWSADECTRKQVIRCGDWLFTTELTALPDGSLAGTQTRAIDGNCTGTYAVSYERQ